MVSRPRQRKLLFRALLLVGVLGLTSRLGVADQPGTVVGSATDATGSPLPFPNVRLSEQSSTEPRYQTTGDAEGRFHVEGVEPAIYTLTVAAKGFREATTPGIRVGPGQKQELGVVRLEVPDCNAPGVICDDFGLSSQTDGRVRLRPATVKNGNTCEFSQAHRRRGWDIPGRHDGKPLRPRMNLAINGKPTDVFVTVLNPPKGIVTLLLPSCSENGLELPMQPVQVQELWQFDAKGRVFAYGVRAGFVATDSARRPIAVGQGTELVFIDDQGDGVFRLMVYGRFPFRPAKPAWLDQLR